MRCISKRLVIKTRESHRPHVLLCISDAETYVGRLACGLIDGDGVHKIAGFDAQMAAPPASLTPEALEVAARTQAAGMRAFVYGSLLGAHQCVVPPAFSPSALCHTHTSV